MVRGYPELAYKTGDWTDQPYIGRAPHPRGPSAPFTLMECGEYFEDKERKMCVCKRPAHSPETKHSGDLCQDDELYSAGRCVQTRQLRDYERQLIEGLPKAEAQRLINIVNAISKNFNVATAQKREETGQSGLTYFGHH